MKSGGPFAEDALAGRVVLVTGAAGRYGLTIASVLEGLGAFLVVTDVDEHSLEMARLALRDSGTRRVSTFVADLTQASEVDRLLLDVVRSHGRLDGLVHCAAILGGAPFLEYDLDEMDRMIALNLRAAIVCAQRSARLMANNGRGSIVLIGSVGSLRAHPSAVVYDACKGALDAGARAMAVDLAPYGIRVNVVAAPVAVDSKKHVREMWDGDLPLGADGILKRDLANAAAFLMSDASARVTGQVLVVDNGLTATLRWPTEGLVR